LQHRRAESAMTTLYVARIDPVSAAAGNDINVLVFE
jgi:hypothetical protein